jgi:hypothetical protein
MKMTSNRRSPRPLHRSLRKSCAPRGATSPLGMNCAPSAVAVMLSDNALMWWDTKLVSLLHVYVPLTGKEADSFLNVSISFCDISNGSLCIVTRLGRHRGVFDVRRLF